MPTPQVGYVLTLEGGQIAKWIAAGDTFPILSNGRINPTVMPIQAAIPNLNLGTLMTLPQVITALGTTQAKINTLLAELRTAGLLAP